MLPRMAPVNLVTESLKKVVKSFFCLYHDQVVSE